MIFPSKERNKSKGKMENQWRVSSYVKGSVTVCFIEASSSSYWRPRKRTLCCTNNVLSGWSDLTSYWHNTQYLVKSPLDSELDSRRGNGVSKIPRDIRLWTNMLNSRILDLKKSGGPRVAHAFFEATRGDCTSGFKNCWRPSWPLCKIFPKRVPGVPTYKTEGL